MRPVEPETHSFIIKVWLEETADADRPVAWRGHITHVPDGVRHYTQSLNDIVGFIAHYLNEMGADITEGEQAPWWLKPWKRKK